MLVVLAGCGTESPAAPRGEERDAPVEHQMLWPFGSVEAAQQWQSESASSGSAPWHLDAEETALAFTSGYLGLAGIDVVVESEIEPTSAEVTVGYRGDGGKPAPAGVVRLVRLGTGENAPWEVIGSGTDDSLTLTEPGYGATVSSPLRVAGLISGVDESIRVRVHAPAVQGPIGEACCVPAGGQDTPWSTTVTLTDAPAATLTVVATTGGHIADVERFAVTAVRIG